MSTTILLSIFSLSVLGAYFAFRWARRALGMPFFFNMPGALLVWSAGIELGSWMSKGYFAEYGTSQANINSVEWYHWIELLIAAAIWYLLCLGFARLFRGALRGFGRAGECMRERQRIMQRKRYIDMGKQ